MTIEQASEQFGVPLDKLHFYEDQGLFDCHKQLDGSIEYTDDLMDYIGIINVLMDAGAEVDALRSFMQRLMQSSITKEEKLRYLRSQRQNHITPIRESVRQRPCLSISWMKQCWKKPIMWAASAEIKQTNPKFLHTAPVRTERP